jgi:hypothetical protein
MSKELLEESHWGWMEAIPRDSADALIANVVGLLHLPDEKEIVDRVACLGSGFLVSVGVKHALCITAAHVLKLRSRLPASNRAPGFEPIIDRSLVGPADRRELVVHVERDG